MSKGFVMTPRLAEVLAELCDGETVEMHLQSIEELQDFVLMTAPSGKEQETLGWISFLRALRSVFVGLEKALKEEQEEEEGKD